MCPQSPPALYCRFFSPKDREQKVPRLLLAMDYERPTEAAFQRHRDDHWHSAFPNAVSWAGIHEQRDHCPRSNMELWIRHPWILAQKVWGEPRNLYSFKTTRKF